MGADVVVVEVMDVTVGCVTSIIMSARMSSNTRLQRRPALLGCGRGGAGKIAAGEESGQDWGQQNRP